MKHLDLLWNKEGYNNYIVACVKYFTIPLKTLAVIGVAQTLKYGFKKYENSKKEYELKLIKLKYEQKSYFEKVIIEEIEIEETLVTFEKEKLILELAKTISILNYDKHYYQSNISDKELNDFLAPMVQSLDRFAKEYSMEKGNVYKNLISIIYSASERYFSYFEIYTPISNT